MQNISTKRKTANSQMIHYHPTHRVSLQPSLLQSPLSYTISPCKHQFSTECLHNFQFFHKPVTLSQGQGNSNWYQNVEFSHVLYHYSKFERNWLINISNTSHCSAYCQQNHLSEVLFSEYQSCNTMVTGTWTDQQIMVAWQNTSKLINKLARKLAQIFPISYIAVTLNEGEGHSNWYQTMK